MLGKAPELPQLWYNKKHNTMKTLIALTIFSLTILTNTSFAEGIENPNNTIQVYSASANSSVTVSWEETTFEEVEILSNNETFMPLIPVMGAQQIHLNNLEDGVYFIHFKTEGALVATKTVTIQNHALLASN